MEKLRLILILLFISNSLFSAGQQDSKEQAEKKEHTITVFTSILPQKYFVERIGGDRVEINVLVGPGKNPAIYDPAPSQVVALSQADIFFTVGVPFEQA
ncbi:MAG: zinc ABC transporter substrate-binding protein, partial [Spirochaetales bacterium]|nr:zinc ABC transporter substrate-binding protein [Spirochaetales bacterium]